MKPAKSKPPMGARGAPVTPPAHMRPKQAPKKRGYP